MIPVETMVDQDAAAMDEIEFLCSNCGAKLSADPSDAGAECECPQCGSAQPIPEPPALGTPIAAVSKQSRKKISVSGLNSRLSQTYPEVVDDTAVGRIFRFLAAMLGLSGLAGLALGFFWVTEAGKPHPAWLDTAVKAAPLMIAGFSAIIVARVAFIIGSLAVRYER